MTFFDFEQLEHLIEFEGSGLELRKKYCFEKKLDNNVLCCVRSTSTVAM